jgi:hypothetical protein
MTPNITAVVALCFLGVFFLLVPAELMHLGFPVWIAVTSAAISGPSYGVFALVFSCPRCRSPLLWNVSDHIKRVRLVPISGCYECHLRTDIRFRK